MMANDPATIQYSVKDLLTQVLSRLDHLDQQMGVVSNQLQGQVDLARRTSVMESELTKVERLLAVHETRPTHEGSPVHEMQADIEKLEIAVSTVSTAGDVHEAVLAAETTAARWRTQMLFVAIGQAITLILFIATQVLRH